MRLTIPKTKPRLPGLQALQGRNLLPVFVLTTLGIQALLLLLTLANRGAIGRISSQEPPSLVQLQSGEAVQVRPLASADARTPKVIRSFIAEIMPLLMSWSAKQGSEGKTPKEIEVEGQTEYVTRAAWEASLALSPEFRESYLKTIAKLTPEAVFNDNTRVSLVPRRVGQPKEIGEGKWRVNLVADLIAFRGEQAVGDAIPFNKQIFVRAVDTPSPQAASGELTDLAKAVYSIREAGLEIYRIRELKRSNL